MLPKKTQDKVLKLVDRYRQKHETDRKKHPNRFPCGWLDLIQLDVRDILAEDKLYNGSLAIDGVIKDLVTQGLLVEYAGDVTFPGEEPLPSREEIVASFEDFLSKEFRL